MNIQNLSICVPAPRCVNNCVYCCSKMHCGDYADNFNNLRTYNQYIKDLKVRMEYARDNGCNTVMLTGTNEPQQNVPFLKVFAEINKSLSKPFTNIEIQTSGAFVSPDMLDFLRDAVGVKTVALSLACLTDSEVNREIICTPDKGLDIETLCKEIKKREMNLRICINLNDRSLENNDYFLSPVEDIIYRYCRNYGANQIICRKLWSGDKDTSQYKWIEENVTSISDEIYKKFNTSVEEGTLLEILPFGLARYDWRGFSVVLDEDSMGIKEKFDGSIKSLIIRPDGHAYSRWDSKASLVF